MKINKDKQLNLTQTLNFLAQQHQTADSRAHKVGQAAQKKYGSSEYKNEYIQPNFATTHTNFDSWGSKEAKTEQKFLTRLTQP